MCLLEVIHVFIFDHPLGLFNFLALVGSQSLDVDLLEDFLFDILDVSAYRGAVDLLALALERMSKIVDKLESVKFLLFGLLVEGSDMFECDSAFLVIMQEYLLAEFNVDFIAINC